MSTTSQVRSVLTDMEIDIYAVENFARLLDYVAESRSMVEPQCLTALSSPLLILGSELRRQFKLAFEAAGGKV